MSYRSAGKGCLKSRWPCTLSSFSGLELFFCTSCNSCELLWGNLLLWRPLKKNTIKEIIRWSNILLSLSQISTNKKSKMFYNNMSTREQMGDNLVFRLISVVAISSVVLALSVCLADVFGLRSSLKVVLPILTFPVHDLNINYNAEIQHLLTCFNDKISVIKH